ncbi:MAG: M6 family metalloprotease domain-containing protein [Prevotella sp.]|nr:M6 family metalloprotease domain-containing protein [Prevotella sp.]
MENGLGIKDSISTNKAYKMKNMIKNNRPKINKRFALVLLLGMFFVTAWCAKAYPGAVTVKQKDGTYITIIQHGDEHFSYVTTTDGVLLFQEGYDYFIARTEANGDLTPTNCLAHNAGQRTKEELKHIAKQNREVFYTAQNTRLNAPRHEPVNSDNTTLFPHTGSPKALVILADFKDEKFKNGDENTKTIFDLYLNGTTFWKTPDATLKNNHGSVIQYFKTMSSNSFSPVFDVTTVVHLPDSMKVYGPGENDNMLKFIPEVCDSAAAQGVDFSLYDSNNDGYVDLVYIIYAGYGQSYSGNSTYCIWPKSGSFNVGTYNGKKVFRYGVHNEINFNPTTTTESYNGVRQINGIGLFCHEFTHTMGLPDFYPTDGSAQSAGVPAMEYWDLMDGGEYSKNGYMPTAYTAWEREAFGWDTIDTLRLDSMGRKVQLIDIDKGGTAYRILKDGEEASNEYMIIQNIQKVGWNQWVGANIGKGMLITHVDYDATAFSLSENSVNNVIGHPRMHVVPADGEIISSYLVKDDDDNTEDGYTKDQYKASLHGDPYPGTSNVTEIDKFDVYTGSMNKAIRSIAENNLVITFYYLVVPIPDEESYKIDEQYKNWIMDEVACDSVVPSYISNTDENGNLIHYSSSFSELSYEFNNLDFSVEKGLFVNVNSKEDITLKVELSAINKETQESINVEQSFDISKNVWTPINADFLQMLSSNEQFTEENYMLSNIKFTTEESTPLFFGTAYIWGNDNGISTHIAIVPTSNQPVSAYYTLDGCYAGQTLDALPHGIYVKNGKKIIK